MRIEVKDVPFGCDFCVVGQLEWTFRLPPGTMIIGTLDKVTGKANVTLSNGFMSACSGCRWAIERPASSRAQVLARRIFRVNPTLRALKGKQHMRALQATIKNYKRLLRHFEPDPRPYCPNEDPLEARGIFFDTEDGPGPEDLN